MQELNPGDPLRRVEFCNNMLERIEINPNLTRQICFSDEAKFGLCNNINPQNKRYWCDENLFETYEVGYVINFFFFIKNCRF